MFLPSDIRKALALLRGQISPVLGGLAVGLGIWFGLMPGFSGIHMVLLVLMVLFNIPIGTFILCAGLGKTVSLATAPVLYHLGLFVQDHMTAIIDMLARVPIVAITDFSRPALAGALVLGPTIGVIMGLATAKVILVFRGTWLRMEEKSEKLRAWQGKRWVRALDWLMISGSAKDARTALTAKTIYIRKAGVILAVLLLILFGAASFFLRNEILRGRSAALLTQANGATVDITKFELAPTSGKVAVAGIGFTDTQDPSKNKIHVGEVSTQANMYELSLGRLILDEVRASDVRFDRPRAIPGQILPKPPEDPNSKWTMADMGLTKENLNKLDQYIEDANKVKAWLQKIKPYLPSGKAPAQVEPPHKYMEYLTATTAKPQFRALAKTILLDKVLLPDGLFGRSNITLTNLNDAPMAAGLPIGLTLKAEQGPSVGLTMDFSSPATAGKVTGQFDGLDLGKLQSDRKQADTLTFRGGKASGRFEGRLTQDLIDLSITAMVTDLQATTGDKGLFGMDAKTTQEVFKSIKDLEIKLQIAGPLTDPRISFDTKDLEATLKAKLVEAGKRKALEGVNKQIDKQLGDRVPAGVKDSLNAGGLEKGLKGLFGGKDPNKP